MRAPYKSIFLSEKTHYLYRIYRQWESEWVGISQFALLPWKDLQVPASPKKSKQYWFTQKGFDTVGKKSIETFNAKKKDY